MVKAAAAAGWLDGRRVTLEILTAIRAPAPTSSSPTTPRKPPPGWGSPQMGTDEAQIDSGQNYPHSDLTERIIGAAFDVHNELGWGFLEKVYENALLAELRDRQMEVTAQPEIPVRYKGKTIGVYNGDLLVAGSVLVEIKALSTLNSVHEQQILHYLKATGIKVGLLLNFGSQKLQIKRLVF